MLVSYMGSIRHELLEQFGIGKEAREQRKAFLKEHGGIAGLKKLREKDGTNGLRKQISSFKSANKGRPGQKPENNTDRPKDPKINDKVKPDADKEWSKKDEEKLSLLKKDPKQFKDLEAKNRSDLIKEINEAYDKKDLAKLRGIVDKSLKDQKLNAQDKLAAFGLGNKEELVLSGKADNDGVFSLYKAKDTKNPFAKITINEKGEFKYESIPRPEHLKTLEDVRNNPNVYKKFEPKSKAETLKALETAISSHNLPELRGIMDYALSQSKAGKELSNEQIRDLIGFSKTGDYKMISTPDNDGKFYLVDSKKLGNQIQFQIQEDGSFKENPRVQK